MDLSPYGPAVCNSGAQAVIIRSYYVYSTEILHEIVARQTQSLDMESGSYGSPKHCTRA